MSKSDKLIGLVRGTVEVVPHCKEWENSAIRTIELLKNILENDFTDIQHIGSTSIKSIYSKPIIDIAVAVNDFSTILKYNELLEKQGIIYRGQDRENQLLYVMGDFENNTRTHHIHIVLNNSIEWNNYINFRDFLNNNTKFAKAYSDLKISLAKKYPNDRNAYTEGKSEMINKILNIARNQKRYQSP